MGDRRPSTCPISPSSSVRSSIEKRELKVRMLYEEYIKLAPIRDSWSDSVTEQPRLEPLFTAGMQGVELSFVLLSHFISDSREYVVKRTRVEMIAEDIQSQMRLLAEIVDGELEDERRPSGAPKGTLTQPFPFDGAPPTSQPQNWKKARQSSGLDLLLDSVTSTFASLREGEKQSLKKVVRNITGAFSTCFGAWSVGVGIEEQLSELRKVVGLCPLSLTFGVDFLDYKALVKPVLISDTLTKAAYHHKEDFFFRSVHLGTECWSFVALERLKSAKREVENEKNWHCAAAHVRSAAHVLHYLGDHVMMLSSMVLRDYLKLKVEIEGTSGAGSLAVKQLRQVTESLLPHLIEVLTLQTITAGGDCQDRRTDPCEEDVVELLVDLYSHPERYPGLYDFSKSLEAVESGLLGGFFYKHFCLANNVIGSEAKGTMKMSVSALKRTYERPLFPMLDFVRAELGRRTDEQLSHLKGRIMNNIESGWHQGKMLSEIEERRTDCSEVAFRAKNHNSVRLVSAPCIEGARKTLYSDSEVPEIFKRALQRELPCNDLLSFLDHAWGKTPPEALAAASKRQFAMYQVGNSTWDKMFGTVIPEASSYIKRILKADPASQVEFGNNSHELISRLISIKLEFLLRDASPNVNIRILTTDTEFYSITRQLNRFQGIPRIEIDPVSVEPLETFEDRFQAAARAGDYDVLYVSHIVFLTQRTVIRNVGDFLHDLQVTTQRGEDNVATPLHANPERMPFIIVDGYHGFGAIPTDLSRATTNCFYVSGLLKHVGGGANCAFLVVPPQTSLRPLFTGWLADPSVLAPESSGIVLGSQVGYVSGFSLLGGTPAFLPSLLIFNEVMRRWSELGITVDIVHNHVMGLQRDFICAMRANRVERDKGKPSISLSSLISLQPESVRSHTLVFKQPSSADAKVVVERLREKYHIEVDSRKGFVRIGLGFNHGIEDVRRLAASIASA